MALWADSGEALGSVAFRNFKGTIFRFFDESKAVALFAHSLLDAAVQREDLFLRDVEHDPEIMSN